MQLLKGGLVRPTGNRFNDGQAQYESSKESLEPCSLGKIMEDLKNEAR